MKDVVSSLLIFSKDSNKNYSYKQLKRFLKIKYDVDVSVQRIRLVDNFLQSQIPYNNY